MGKDRSDDNGHAYREDKETGHHEHKGKSHRRAKHNQNDPAQDDGCVL